MVVGFRPHRGCRIHGERKIERTLQVSIYRRKIIMPPQRKVRGRPFRRNVEDSWALNGQNVQPQGEKEGRYEDIPPPSWACFDEAFLRRFFPRELKKAKVWEFLTLKQDSLSVHEYGLNFTQLSRYAPEMVKDMRSRMSLFVSGLGCASSKEGKAAMLIGYMDISRLIVYVQQVEEEKLRNKEEYRNTKANTGMNLIKKKLVQVDHI
ncbi:uncharacterized protein LOC107019531 [Solanum pennellii]|uniref:Uncharacterized protein LOC107019531 n=1 Tax=Solanum pennellii TaxID=28526 RepID=A0ABM1GSW5_SOLPN|nr:uncharacterized protein LOC107019531 [Solanum pennellii]